MRSHPLFPPPVPAPAPALAQATLVGSVLALCLLVSAPLGAAPPLADPTQPPDFTPGAGGRTVSTAARLAAEGLRTPALHQLQAVQTSARGVATALINGRVVRVGDLLGDGPSGVTVQAIDADGVTLLGPHYRQRLALTPGGTKTPSAATNEIVITRSRASSEALAGPPAGGSTATPLAPPAPPPVLSRAGVIKESP